jgi:hypothetical protein
MLLGTQRNTILNLGLVPVQGCGIHARQFSIILTLGVINDDDEIH